MGTQSYDVFGPTAQIPLQAMDGDGVNPEAENGARLLEHTGDTLDII